MTSAKSLLAKGVKHVLVTLVGEGNLWVTADKVEKIAAYKVETIDTTAAGDCFLAAFVSCFTGCNFLEAMDFGARAAAIAVTRQGAQTSIPTSAEVESFR